MTYFLKDCTKKVLKIYKSIAVENFKPVPLCPIKWRPLKFFAKLHKSPILISNIVSGLRQFLTTESPWKIMNNTFCFILTNWICYWQIRFCTYYAFSLNQMSYICEVWKYWPLKDSYYSISQKFYRAAILWWVDQKVSTLLADISFVLKRAAFKILYCRIYYYFCVLAIKLI